MKEKYLFYENEDSYDYGILNKNIIIIGKSEYVSNKEIKLIRKIIFDKLLKKSKIKNKLKIRIVWSDDFREYGWCGNLNFYKTYPKEFEIYLNNKKAKRISQIRTIIHELTHVVQFATKRLKEADDGSIRWMGKPWVPRKGEKIDKHSPWEIEAKKNEKEYYKEVKQALNV